MNALCTDSNECDGGSYVINRTKYKIGEKGTSNVSDTIAVAIVLTFLVLGLIIIITRITAQG